MSSAASSSAACLAPPPSRSRRTLARRHSLRLLLPLCRRCFSPAASSEPQKRVATWPPCRAARRREALRLLLRRGADVLACAANKSRVWLCGWRTGGVHKCCCCGARRDRLALWLWRTHGMVCEAARTMRMPQGTRVAAHTSPWRSNESSPKLNMTVDEQLPPVRTVAGGADGQGSTVIFRSGGLTLRNSHCVAGRAMSPDEQCRRKSHRWPGAASPENNNNAQRYTLTVAPSRFAVEMTSALTSGCLH